MGHLLGKKKSLDSITSSDFKDLREKNIQETKKDVSQAFDKSHLIIHAVNTINEIDMTINLLGKRFFEWFSLYNPELAYEVQDYSSLASASLEHQKGINSMGMDFSDEDSTQILSLATKIQLLSQERIELTQYIETLLIEIAPNVQAVAGTMIAAKLLDRAGSLKSLMMMPYSTVQTLGAEKALFKHMRNKKIRPPKHGLILQHPYVAKSKAQDRGKAARLLAERISMAARIDYFKGEFQGDRLKGDLK